MKPTQPIPHRREVRCANRWPGQPRRATPRHSRGYYRYPELQPIERVWACVKNEIARTPVLGITELLQRLKSNFRLPEDDGCMSLKVMHMTVRKTRLQEDLYTAAHLEAITIATEAAAEAAEDAVTLEPEDPDDESVCAHTQGDDDLQDDFTGEESEDDDDM